MLSDKQREVREKRIGVVLRCLAACAPVLMVVFVRVQSRGWASLAVWFFAGILLSGRHSDA